MMLGNGHRNSGLTLDQLLDFVDQAQDFAKKVEAWTKAREAAEGSLAELRNESASVLATALEQRLRELDDFTASRRADADRVVAEAIAEAERITDAAQIQQEAVNRDREAFEEHRSRHSDKLATREKWCLEQDARLAQKERELANREEFVGGLEEENRALKERMSRLEGALHGTA